MKTQPELIIFDLDGTLVDSAPDLALAINAMLDDLKLPRVSEDSVRLWVGNGSAKLVERTLAHHESAVAQTEAHALFMQHYQANLNRASRLYEHCKVVLEGIKAKGIPMALVTNKPFEFVPPLLEALGIETYFELMIGGDSLAEKKPSPLPLLHCAEQLAVPVSACLMVGDSKADIQSAKAANMPIVALSQGYNQGLDLSTFGPDALIPQLKNLPEYLRAR